ncbi:DotU family type IV/VI secretion system protein [Haliangium sp.]|uniref:DotU family type IV/VI secretion system protein n=1 Tax=Haliangium sp. TaxID=2663208 RepID=UPI003D10A4CC
MLRCQSEVDALVQVHAPGVEAFPGQLDEAAGASLAALHDRVRQVVGELRDALHAEPERDRVTLLLVLYLDERIMHRLSDAHRLRWPPLQREWLGTSRGGDEFYRILDRLLEDPRTASILFETFYYCLANGFVGRYAGHPDIIAGYGERLRERIAVPELSPDPASPVRPGRLPPPFRPGWYYLGTALAMLALAVLATVLTG